MTARERYEGKLYRALNPLWASRPLSGEGAARYGGRFNPVGMQALYCSRDPLTALREANQVGDLQPSTLVAFDTAIEGIFDGQSAKALDPFGLAMRDLADDGWRDSMQRDGEAPTQRFARALMEAGYSGISVPSFARGATGTNLVLWRWSSGAPHRLTLIDDEGRLT